MTNGKLIKRLKNAVLHVDKTKEYRAVMFGDRGIKIEIEEDVAIISRLSFNLCFSKVVSGGYSRIYMMLASVVDMVNRYDCIAEDEKVGKFTSYWKMWDAVRNNEAQEGGLGILTVFSVWFDVLQSTLFLAPERADETFALNAIYTTQMMIHGVLSKPYDKDMTNKELWAEIEVAIKDYMAQMTDEDYVVIKNETKEEREQAVAEAMHLDELDKTMEEQGNAAG